MKVIRAVVRTDHSAVLATTEDRVRDRTKTSYKRSFRIHSPEQHAKILLHLGNFKSSGKEAIDPEQAWMVFYDVTEAVLVAAVDRFTPGERIRRPCNGGLFQGLRLHVAYAIDGEDDPHGATGLHY